MTPITPGSAPAGATPFNPADREARSSQVSQHIDEVIALCDITPRSPSETEAKKSRYGRMVPQAADATIEMVQGCAEPFAGLTRNGRTVEERLRTSAGKAAYLQGVMGKLDEARVLVQGELNGTNGELVGDVEDCRQTMVSTLSNPAARGATYDLLGSSSTKLRGLLDVRNQAYQTSRETAGGLRDEVKARESEVADLDRTVARQDVELKFHSGVELTPEDVILAPRTIAAPMSVTAPRVSRARGAASTDPEPRRPAGRHRKTSR